MPRQDSANSPRTIIVPKVTFQRLRILAALFDITIEEVVNRLTYQAIDDTQTALLIKNFTRYYQPLKLQEEPPTQNTKDLLAELNKIT